MNALSVIIDRSTHGSTLVARKYVAASSQKSPATYACLRPSTPQQVSKIHFPLHALDVSVYAAKRKGNIMAPTFNPVDYPDAEISRGIAGQPWLQT